MCYIAVYSWNNSLSVLVVVIVGKGCSAITIVLSTGLCKDTTASQVITTVSLQSVVLLCTSEESFIVEILICKANPGGKSR